MLQASASKYALAWLSFETNPTELVQFLSVFLVGKALFRLATDDFCPQII
jgi:hypothetical protein